MMTSTTLSYLFCFYRLQFDAMLITEVFAESLIKV